MIPRCKSYLFFVIRIFFFFFTCVIVTVVVDGFVLSSNHRRRGIQQLQLQLQQRRLSCRPPTTALYQTNNSNNERQQQQKHQKEIIVKISDEIVLPGETISISIDETEEKQLIHDCINHYNGILALGILLTTSSSNSSFDDDESKQIQQIASLCQIDTFNDITNEVTLTSIGRVQLNDLLDELDNDDHSSYHKFYCTTYDDESPTSKDDLIKANIIADNIEKFIDKLTTKERNLCLVNEKECDELVSRYKTTYAKYLQMDTTTVNEEEEDDGISNNILILKSSKDYKRSVQLLTAISWSSFSSACVVNDKTEEDTDETEEEQQIQQIMQYRLRALDWNNLLERLKLAQYMLQEKELRLLGYEMSNSNSSSLKSDNNNISTSDDDYFDEGFQ